MERIETNADRVELGDAAEMTRGPEPVGMLDTDGILFRAQAGLSQED